MANRPDDVRLLKNPCRSVIFCSVPSTQAASSEVGGAIVFPDTESSKDNTQMPRVRLDLPDRFPFRTEIALRVSDINYGGHLGNDAVLALAQEARLQFLRSHGWSEQDIAGTGIIMTDAVVIYRSEAFYGDVLTVDVAVADLQQLGCDFLFRMVNKDSGKEVARVKTGIAFFDYARHRPTGMPEAFRSAVAPSSPELP